jgi:hypothetical protein
VCGTNPADQDMGDKSAGMLEVSRGNFCQSAPGNCSPGFLRHHDAEPLMSSSLLTTRRFAPLFWCQFFSAFNDNFLKNSLVFLILFKMAGQDPRP